ncbi:MAG: lipoate--protein ligase family protein [Gammaproteobacteria bacterium]|nr:lipoate--protein ligase family protein [Gammaproteobacteria bacterium]
MNIKQQPKQWRLIDTGIRPAAENFAINRAILEAHQQGESPHTLRFLGFRPSALIGFHQDVEQELNTDYIREHGIDIQRRLTGGGAIYFDEQQFGWELYLNRQILGGQDMASIAERICNTIASAMQSLGINAMFRPRNDIEVDGRKISGTGGFFDGDSFLYQGTVLVDFDVERMMRVLRIPAAKINDKAIADARQRTTTFREILEDKTPPLNDIKSSIADAVSREFEVTMEQAQELNDVELGIYQEALSEIDSDDWVYQHNRPYDESSMLESMYKSPGGLLKSCVMIDRDHDRLKQVWISGDFFIKPRRLVTDLEAALRNTRLSELRSNIEAFFRDYPSELLMLSADDFIQVIQMAIDSAEDR